MVAYNQLQTYKDNIPDLFNTNGVLVISVWCASKNGITYCKSRTVYEMENIDGEKTDPLGKFRDLETLIKGLFKKDTFLDFIKYFSIFEGDSPIIKKVAGYHQFYAVQKALEKIVEVSKVNGNKKGGVVWHTQGAGKSLEMTVLQDVLFLTFECKIQQ